MPNYGEYTRGGSLNLLGRYAVLNREDINKYNTTSMEIPSGRAEGELSQTAGATAKTVGGMVWKAVKTLLCIFCLLYTSDAADD